MFEVVRLFPAIETTTLIDLGGCWHLYIFSDFPKTSNMSNTFLSDSVYEITSKS